MVRLKWWGLYHDKPKVGTFMLRIKLPGGLLTPAQLRAIGEISTALRPRRRRADDAAERPAPLDRARRAAGGLRAARGGRADDRRRLRRHGAQHHRLPRRRHRARRAVRRDAAASRRRPSSSTGTRTTPTCRASTRSRSRPARDRCNAPEINCISLVGVVHEGREGFAVLAGGGLSSVPRLARDLGVFVPKEEALEVHARAARRLARGPDLPRLARQVADEVHGRRLRAGGRARRGRGAARPRARGLRARRRRRTGSPTTSASTRRSSPGSSTSASPSISASSRATR